VNLLHTIELQADRSAAFVLTIKIEVSKNIIVLRQLLKFTRLVRRPGLEQGHLSHRKMLKGRLARVYSKALVEANKKIRRRQDRIPRRWVGLSGWR